jgi:hypothetical protein
MALPLQGNAELDLTHDLGGSLYHGALSILPRAYHYVSPLTLVNKRKLILI